MVGHIIKVSLYVFISLSFIFSENIVNVQLDPISHNTFYLDSVYPKYQPDLFIGDYLVDGGLGFPLSVYMVENLYTNLSDSIRTTSSLLYHQGDVGYRKVAIDIQTKVGSSGLLKVLANGLACPGRFSQYASGNILQNYLLHFSKKYNSSTISFYSGYHLEDRETNYINSNSGEAYFSGFNYDWHTHLHKLNFKYAFQIGQTNYENLTDYCIMWGVFDSEYYLTDAITPYIRNKYKNFYFDSHTYYLNNVISGLSFNMSLATINLAINTYLSNLPKSSHLPIIFPNIILKTKFKNFNINTGISSEYWNRPIISNVSLSDTILDGYSYLFFNMSFSTENIDIEIEPRAILENNYNKSTLTLNSKLKLSYDVFKSKVQVIPYLLSFNKMNISLYFNNNFYNTLNVVLKNHISSSLIISELESDRRYKKFFGIKYNGVQFNQDYLLGLNDLSIYNNTEVADWPWSNNNIRNYLDLHFGIEFNKFIFSWHFTNILSDNYIMNTKDGNGYWNMKKINIKYFSVNWKFDD